jgi:hypothetical protein
MAERVALQIDVDAGRSGQTLGKIEKDISGINKEMTDLTEINQEFKLELIELERRFKKIPKTALQARKKIGDQMDHLKASIKDNNHALENFRLKKKQLSNMKRDMKAMSNEFVESTETVLGFGASLGEAAAGFMLLTGASEEDTEQLEKAIGVMFTFEGVAKSVSGAMKIWNQNLKETAIGQKIVTAGQWLWTTAVGATSGALKLFRIALMATGIGAIIIGVVALVMNFGKLVKWVKNITGGMGAFGKVVKQMMMIALFPLIAVIEAVKWGLQKLGILESEEEKAKRERAEAEAKRTKAKLESIANQIKELERLAKREKEISDLKIKGLDNEIKIQKSLGKETIELERQKLKILVESAKEQDELTRERIRLKKLELQLIWDELNATAKIIFSKEKQQEILKSQVDHIKEFDLELKKSAQSIKDAEADLLVFENKIEKEREEKSNKRSEKKKQEREEKLERDKQALFDLEVARKEADAEDILDEQKKAEALINIERFKHEKELENKKLTDAEKELLEFEYQQRIADISQEFVDAEFEREQAEAERLAELQDEKIENEKEAREKKLEADKEAAEKKLEFEKQVQDESFNLALGGIDALMQLNDAFQGQTEAQQKKAFERNKKLQIAQALISASQGVVNILANASTIPDPFGTVYKVGQLAILSAVTTAQIAKISQQQFSGGGSVSAPNISGGGGTGAPKIAPVTNTSTLVPQEPQQVYVTETDISNTQNKVAVIETQATIK